MKGFLFIGYSALLLLTWNAIAAETRVMSAIVGFQFPEDLTAQVVKSGIPSPFASYQYFEWPGDDVLTLHNSRDVSFYYDGRPVVTTQPTDGVGIVGSSMTIAIRAAGSFPLTFQWFFNGIKINAATSEELPLTNLQLSDSGIYWVIVSNPYGTIQSRAMRLSIFLSPSEPKPPLPISTTSKSNPPENLILPPRKPTSAQLIVFNEGGVIDSTKMTIILTHGWHSGATDWPMQVMKPALFHAGYYANANVLAWDWSDTAKADLLMAANRAPSEGEALGQTLLETLGATYSRPLHFIGHSLGTIVNCRAADYVHGDASSSPGRLSGSTLKFHCNNTHVTLLDEAELVTLVNGVYVSSLSWRLNPDTAGTLYNNFAFKVIPDHSGWIDNYVSEVGIPHPEAANAFLWRNAALGIQDAHGYSYNWYAASIANPTEGLMGFRWSFERGTIDLAPSRGTYFVQNANADPWTLQVTKIESPTEAAIAFPLLQDYRAFIAGANTLGRPVMANYMDGIEYIGDLLADMRPEYQPPLKVSSFIGPTAESTPMYYNEVPDVQQPQGSWNLEFTVSPSLPPLILPRKQTITESRFVYASVPVDVPSEAASMSFEFQVQGAGTNELLSMGISNKSYLTIETRFLEDSAWNPSPVINISEYSGKQIPIFFLLNDSDGSPKGRLSVRGMHFYAPATPTLAIETNADSGIS